MRSRLLVVAVVAVLACLAGCGSEVGGKPVASFGEVDPGKVAGLPVENGPSGPKQGVPDASLPVRGASGDSNDRLAINALVDVIDFWKTEMPKTFGKEFQPLKGFVSYNSSGKEMEVCGDTSQGYVNAFYCPSEDIVGWDRGVLLPFVRKQFGDLSVVSIFAHEMGHAVQYRLSEQTGVDESTETIVKEQQADCFAGAFFRWVVEGNAEHFDMSTGEGINQVLATMLFIRDEPGSKTWQDEGAHGTAFDRSYALQTGFAKGTKRCAQMNLEEIEGRQTEVEFAAQDVAGGNVQLDTQTLGLLKQSLDAAFGGRDAPQIVADTGRCASGESTPPASYCRQNNTINVDPVKLIEYATPPDDGDISHSGSGGIGDFAAFAEIASRYALAVQHRLGVPLDDRMAGLRTTCLTGAWAKYASERHPDQSRLQLLLSSGDLDEAIAELLMPRSVISSDVAGNRVASGFARVDAFQVGYLEGSRTCTDRFR